jgi:glucose-6-phosphate isomerase
MAINFNYNTFEEQSHACFQDQFQASMLNQFNEVINSESIGFFHYTDNLEVITEVKRIHQKHQDKKNFVQVGIGGSALGPQMLTDALLNSNVNFYWVDNTDSEYLFDVFHSIDVTQTLFYIVSKSGGTAETMAGFAIAQNLLLDQGVKKEDLKNYFVFCTDPHKSELRDLANDEGFDCLDIPSNVGGRFSVLTPVGLLPAIFAGLNLEAMFNGANELKPSLLEKSFTKNPLLKTAAILNFLHQEMTPSVNQTVLMPYSSKLKTLSHWFVQLWGESLGKYSEHLKKNVGLTPIPAYGATDQHSQMQLFMEGENDKALFLLEVKGKKNDFKLTNTIGTQASEKLNGRTLNQLIEAQFHGTLKALKDRKRNVFHISIDRNDEEHLGALVLFFESLTALMGIYMSVNAFNQPGVELGKIYAYEYLENLRG